MYQGATKATEIAVLGTALTGFSWFAQLPIWSAISFVLAIGASVASTALVRREKSLVAERLRESEKCQRESEQSLAVLSAQLVILSGMVTDLVAALAPKLPPEVVPPPKAPEATE